MGSNRLSSESLSPRDKWHVTVIRQPRVATAFLMLTDPILVVREVEASRHQTIEEIKNKAHHSEVFIFPEGIALLLLRIASRGSVRRQALSV